MKPGAGSIQGDGDGVLQQSDLDAVQIPRLFEKVPVIFFLQLFHDGLL